MSQQWELPVRWQEYRFFLGSRPDVLEYDDDETPKSLYKKYLEEQTTARNVEKIKGPMYRNTSEVHDLFLTCAEARGSDFEKNAMDVLFPIRNDIDSEASIQQDNGILSLDLIIEKFCQIKS